MIQKHNHDLKLFTTTYIVYFTQNYKKVITNKQLKIIEFFYF